MPAGILYRSFVEPSGYGLAGIAYVRALVNAGVPVRWEPLQRVRDVPRPASPAHAFPRVLLATDDESLDDLPALLAATARPIDCDTVVVHTVPEHWPGLFEPGKRNVGCTVWETDRIPAHWRTLIDRADRVVVPCEFNRTVFEAAGVRPPVRVVPHVRRHAWNGFAPAEIADARTRYGIADARFVFLSINAWDPRKALPSLLRAFVRAFGPDDGVALVLKTGPTGSGPPPAFTVASTLAMAQQAVDEATDEIDRDAPPICVLPTDLTGRGVDLLHEIADAYVTLTHSEGWGIGLFDAATRGTPAIATGYGGQLDYLGTDWPGAVRWRPARVPVFPPHRPSYWPSQRWAAPDLGHAIELMRALAADPAPARAHAATIAERIANDFAEPVVARRFVEAIA